MLKEKAMTDQRIHMLMVGEIAKRLSISVRTVERHRYSIMNKLGMQNRAELIAYAVQQGRMSGET